jgi:DNA-3-methyladenine glycosylase
MNNILKKDFYEETTKKVAQKLLGKFLCRQTEMGMYVGKIVETEAYLGEKDLASHARKGRTDRTEIMFGPAGYAYIYMIYGMYYCFNIVTEKNGTAGAVLIRALEPIILESQKIKSGQKDFAGKNIEKILNGPGKLCREFKIGKELNGVELSRKNGLWLENGDDIPPRNITKTKRIGVDYAGKWKDKSLRFYIKDNPFVSKK